ncbi:MAG TPA: 4Fe-4S dicluster domain-containing protein [Syntrophales bacterium]|nr:4Fe-4S dicluster domain-containing protein [Syntrophales bacterium]
MIDRERRRLLKIAGTLVLGSMLPVLPCSASSGKGIVPAAGAGRLAMVVDPGKCPPGCRDCIDACHTIHNVPDIAGSGKQIRWIRQVPFRNAFPEQGHPYLDDGRRDVPVLALCNHCENPPCVRVCPTKATFRRSDGIVAMDYHRCIGCRFCIAACPYGSRSMNFRDPRPFLRSVNPDYPTRTRGVVEKCNFCEERLAKGMPPACVEACGKRGGLLFGDIADPSSEVRRLVRDRRTVRRRPELGTEPHVFYIVS